MVTGAGCRGIGRCGGARLWRRGGDHASALPRRECGCTPAGLITDEANERAVNGRYHDSSMLTLSVVVTPTEGEHPAHWGQNRFDHTADAGPAANRHPAATIRQPATPHGSDGSVLVAGSVAHIPRTARPNDPSGVIRLFFEHSHCAEVSQ
jgi:hypothetical protein